jgi:hypothetical protein
MGVEWSGYWAVCQYSTTVGLRNTSAECVFHTVCKMYALLCISNREPFSSKITWHSLNQVRQVMLKRAILTSEILTKLEGYTYFCKSMSSASIRKKDMLPIKILIKLYEYTNFR